MLTTWDTFSPGKGHSRPLQRRARAKGRIVDYVEALRIQDRLRDLGYVTSVLAERRGAQRWYVLAGDQRQPKYQLATESQAARLFMAIQRLGGANGWHEWGASA